MKKRLLIACTMQIDIIKKVMKTYHIDMPVIWIDRKLHNDIRKLNQKIYSYIQLHQDMDEILLSYGLCGNAVLGLCSDKTKLIMPAFDDCISQSLYLGTEKSYGNINHIDKGCYYLTREWTIDQEAIVQQCEKIYEQYGIEEGQQIIDEIYEGYHSIVVIETGAYEKNKILDYAKQASKYTRMKLKTQKGSAKVIENLILQRYDKTIAVFYPGEMIEQKRLKELISL